MPRRSSNMQSDDMDTDEDEDYGMPGGQFGGFGKGSSSMPRRSSQQPRKDPAIEKELVCSLEELYKGVSKKMKVKKTIYDNNGGSQVVEKVLEFDVKPGYKEGTKITFERQLDEKPGVLPGDLIFIVKEKPHPTFKRQGNDLIYTAKLTLKQALTSNFVDLTTLDGRNLHLQINDVISPKLKHTVANEGMPISKQPGKKGNLIVEFDIDFPKSISNTQKEQLTKIL